MENTNITVGINMLIFDNDGKILLGRRCNVFGAGTYGLIGGKMREGETIEECAIRELKKEIGIEVSKEDLEVMNIATTNLNKQFIQIGIKVNKYKGIPEIKEKEKCDDLQFFDLNNLPELFAPTKTNINLFVKNKFYDKNENL